MRKNGPVPGVARLPRNAPNSAVAKNAAANGVKPINANPISVNRIKLARHVSPSRGR